MGCRRFTGSHIAQIRSELRRSWGADSISRIQETVALTSLDRASIYEPELLKHFSSEISLLLASSSALCRGLAYRLLFRYMKYVQPPLT